MDRTPSFTVNDYVYACMMLDSNADIKIQIKCSRRHCGMFILYVEVKTFNALVDSSRTVKRTRAPAQLTGASSVSLKSGYYFSPYIL